MDMLDDIAKELPTNGLKVADLINAFNARLAMVSTALTQLDKKQDAIETKLERKLDEQDRALDEIKAVQARAPTRADLAELQKEQMSRETYEVRHDALKSQVLQNATDLIAVRAVLEAFNTRLQGSSQKLEVLELWKSVVDKSPVTRRSVLALWLTGIGIGTAILCSGASTVVSVLSLILRH